MRYIYDVYDSNLQRVDTATKFEGLVIPVDGYITVCDMLLKPPRVVNEIWNEEDAAAWRTAIERSHAWKPFDAEESEITMKGSRGPSKVVTAIVETSEMVDTPSKSEKTKDHINPSHYHAYLSIPELDLELRWLETKQYQNHWKNPDEFKAAVLLQADKYLSRLGRKDSAVQDLLKGIWYLKFLAAYIANDNKPIRVKNIENILESVK